MSFNEYLGLFLLVTSIQTAPLAFLYLPFYLFFLRKKKFLPSYWDIFNIFPGIILWSILLICGFPTVFYKGSWDVIFFDPLLIGIVLVIINGITLNLRIKHKNRNRKLIFINFLSTLIIASIVYFFFPDLDLSGAC